MKAKYGNFIAPLQRSAASASSIWKGLNWCKSTMQEGRTADLSDCLRSIRCAYKEFSSCQAPQPHFDPVPDSGQCKNVAPYLTEEWSIIHTDAAWSTNCANLAGTRNNPNMPISHSWVVMAETSSPLQAEAKAASLAISLALDHGWRKVWIRSDTLLLVDAIIFPHQSSWEIKSIVSDIFALLPKFWD
ncbi:hypothetical protein CRG98_034441 [Punica granatum]|uniref:RNase H type-1 domain-containing protein n=1 Tax=Punica granatum TaxID=22663 RepID=A0A2I0IMC8_PUNGR|nr:hypothetical protein CRG98_034441 [Punica granatum]